METKTGTVQIVKQDSVHISLVGQPTDESITIKYHTLNDNRPDVNGNYIGLWQTDSEYIPARKANKAEPIRSSKTSAEYTFNMGIGDDSYILGYCQTGNPAVDQSACTNISACTWIHSITSDAECIDSAVLDITGSTGSAIVSYKLLENTNPTGHWFGIWRKNMIIGSDMPIYKNLVLKEDPEKIGKLVFNDVPFVRGTGYTLAYFVGSYDDHKLDVSKMLAYMEFTF